MTYASGQHLDRMDGEEEMEMSETMRKKKIQIKLE